MELRRIFAHNLQRVRLERGLSQEELAHRAGLERSYVGKLENARFSVSLDTIEKIALALETSAAALLESSAGASLQSKV